MSIAAQGTLLTVGNGSATETQITVGEVLSISGPDVVRSELDTTTLSDTTRRTAAGLLDGGSVTASLRLNFGDTGQDRIRTVAAANTRSTFTISVPAGALGSGSSSTATTINFSGYVVRWMPVSAQVDGLIEAQITIRLDGGFTES